MILEFIKYEARKCIWQRKKNNGQFDKMNIQPDRKGKSGCRRYKNEKTNSSKLSALSPLALKQANCGLRN